MPNEDREYLNPGCQNVVALGTFIVMAVIGFCLWGVL